MRLFIAVAASCFILVASPAVGEQIFPYKAFVTADDVYVRSGPGQTYYPTDKLEKGQEVEIYRHDPGGWYAIRPPEGSFTWVSGRYLKAGVDSLAVVTDDRVAGRVGSRFSSIRDVIQVRLHKAEVVEVLEKKPGSGGDVWYKIAPPSGEFRWVFGKYVDPGQPDDGVRKTREPVGDETPTDPGEAEAAAPSTSITPAQRQEPLSAEPPIIVRPPSDSAGLPAEANEPTYTSSSARRMSPEEYREQLQQIDIELSTMVVEEPTVWEFGEMRYRAEEMLDLAETAVQRGLARVLANKIIRFEDIKRRHDRINVVRRETERSNRRLARLGPPERSTDRELASERRFDGVGELTRVVSPQLGAPRYALVDASGGLRCYVSPVPGVNLRHYVGRRVGVNGTRGYIPEQRAQHIMAQHVSALDGRLW